MSICSLTGRMWRAVAIAVYGGRMEVVSVPVKSLSRLYRFPGLVHAPPSRSLYRQAGQASRPTIVTSEWSVRLTGHCTEHMVSCPAIIRQHRSALSGRPRHQPSTIHLRL